ncbi:hypothetical protein GR268_36645 [Rhizobium leguminosarum]|nr:hypothetical protein [Rhizobium leguminosarum]
MRRRMRIDLKRKRRVHSAKISDREKKYLGPLMTRRALFQGSGAAALIYSVADPAYADSAPQVEYDAVSKSTVWVRYLGKTWRLQSREFGPAATLHLSGAAPSWKILIEGSGYPGTTLSANGHIQIIKREGVWCVEFAFGSFGLVGGLLLADWMAGTHQPKAIVKNKKNLEDRLPHKSVLLGPSTAVGFARVGKTDTNVFFFEDGAQAIILARDGLRASVQRLEITVGYASNAVLGATSVEVGPSLRILFDRLPKADCTVLSLEHIAKLDDKAAFVVSASGASFELADVEVPSGSVRCFNEGANALTAMELHFSGTLVGEGNPKETGAAWPRLPLQASRYQMVDDGKSIELAVIASLPDKPFLTNGGHIRLVLGGTEEREILRALLVNGKSEIKSFSIGAKLYSAFVPMHAADYSRFDFRDTKLEFVLEELLKPHQLNTTGSVFLLANVPTLGAALHDKATLAVHRAADLLDLKYSFRNLYLRSTPTRAQIEKCSTTFGGVALPASTPALMIVHFSPQSITEKAYLRVSEGVQVGQADVSGETTTETQRRRGMVVPIGEHRAYETGGTVPLKAAVQNPDANLAANLVEAKGVRDADFPSYVTKKFKDIDLLEALDRVVEARAAGATRIAFEIPETAEPVPEGEAQPSPILPLVFSLDSLTDWTRLKTKVSARALPPTATPLEQLTVAGITPATPTEGINGKLWSIKRSLFQHGAPSPEETAIEFPYRLQLSPASDARWSTPRTPNDEAIKRGIPPFYARLDPERGGRSVRAIWSTDFGVSFGAFLHDEPDKRRHPAHSNDAPWLPVEKSGLPLWLQKYLSRSHPYRMSLDGRDRHELVLLSSVYGLPALLPMPTVSTSGTKKQEDKDKPADPYVVPLPPGFTQAHNQFLGYEGLYVPRPLSRTDITLSALGATVDIEGQWDPPSGFTLENKDTPLWPALTVERWKHRAFQGRDMFVEIVYKGFIFPFGHRCSVVKATERSFFPDPRSPDDHSATVAYLTQRFFVLIGEPEKRYPAVGQPFAGRAMPYAGVRILTTKSPSILDPFENAIGGEHLSRAKEIGAYAFFPKVADNQEVSFEFEVTYADGRASKRLSAPLVVADNTLVHDPCAVQQLIAFYNSLEANAEEAAPYKRLHRQVNAFDQRLKYAPEQVGGDTEFRTRSWLLGAHAREIEDPDDETSTPRLLPFMMDAVMEGADQPPFYPAIEAAELEIQSLNAMNGRTEGFTEVAHDLHFLRYGFAPGSNDAEIYLTVRQPNYLKLENRANSSGGIATPNNRVTSISRRKGPVGGGTDTLPGTELTLIRLNRRDDGVAATLNVATVDAESGKPSFSYSLPASHQNKFDPLEFFGKALSQAKLFGIIPLKDVVRAISFVDGAPEMIESTVYSLLGAGDELKGKVSLIAGRVRDAVNETIEAFEAKLKELGIKVGVELTSRDIYPQLIDALQQLVGSLDRFESSAEGFDPLKPETEEPVIAAISKVVAAADRALSETRKVVQKPTPAIIEQTIGELQQALSILKDGVGGMNGLAVIVRDYLTDQVVAQIRSEFSGLLSQNICDDEALFPLAMLAFTGYPDTDLSARSGKNCVTFDILDPKHRRRAQEAILYEMVSKPLIDGYMAFDTLVAKFEDALFDFETSFKDLPSEILSVVEKWVDGMLRLEQYAAMGSKLFEGASATLWKDVISPALLNYIVPLVHFAVKNSDQIRSKGNETSKRISVISAGLLKAIQSGKAGPLQSQLEQVASTIAKVQKALSAVLDQHDQIRTLLGEYFDLAAAPNTDAYVKPLKTAYDAGRMNAVAQFNGLVGRLFVEKDALFRRSRDAMTASLDAIDLLARLDDLLSEGNGFARNLTASTPSDLQTEMRKIVREVALLLGDIGALIDAAGKIDRTHFNIDQGVLTRVAGIKLSHQQIVSAIERIKVQPDVYANLLEPATQLTTTFVNLDPKDIDQATILDLKAKSTKLAAATDDAIAFVFGQERVMAGAMSQATSLFSQTQTKVETAVYGVVTKLLTPMIDLLISIDALAVQVHGKLKALINKPAAELEILELFLSQEFLALIGDTNNKINEALTGAVGELTRLAGIKGGLSGSNQQKRDAAEAFFELIGDWRREGGRPAAIRVLEPLSKTIESLMTGKLGDLVDFTRVERAVADVLLEFVPKEVAFDYGWGTKLDPFPSETTKLFWINTAETRTLPPPKSMLAKHFETKKQDPALPSSDDLVIVAKAGVRLERNGDTTNFTPKPFFAVESQIITPSINLFGASFDVVTINFQHLRFTADENGTDFDAKIVPGIEGVKFGPAVEYITKLASLFPKFVPPWLELMFAPPGVALKYGFPAFTVSIGTMAISNLSVGIRIEIPFDNRPLLGKLTLSERNKPFLISFAPYGGGGYLALRTQATSIVGFEMQLEFGAVVVIAFGPLNGFGMVCAGIYIEKVEGQDLIIAGFVRALGEGSLGCFSIAVQLEVRVTQQNGNMTGQATFSFSFRVGFADLRFQFTAAYTFVGEKGGGAGALAAPMNAGTQAFQSADTGPEPADQLLQCSNPAKDKKDGERGLKVRVRVGNRFDDWKAYSEYFG